MVYALHCTDDTLPFVAVWYVSTIILCTLADAALSLDCCVGNFADVIVFTSV